MENYENASTSEVQRLAKQGDKDALYEMAWRMSPDVQSNPVDSCAWQDYWFEKAADAGNIDAKSRYARSLLDRPIDKEWREKAAKYFEELLADYNAGRLTGDSELHGILAQFWLGVMLCQGYHTQRDALRGVKLLENAQAETNDFEEFGFRFHRTLGELYATGLAQPSYNPSNADLDKAIMYLDNAVKRFNPENDDPNNRGFLQITKDLLDLQRRRKQHHNPNETVPQSEINETRQRNMEVLPAVQQRVNADKSALAQLRQRLAREGWSSIGCADVEERSSFWCADVRCAEWQQRLTREG